jgi:hypothetical protein
VQKRLINLGKLVSHMDKIYGDFHQAVSIPKVTKRIELDPGLTDLVSKYEDAYPL